MNIVVFRHFYEIYQPRPQGLLSFYMRDRALSSHSIKAKGPGNEVGDIYRKTLIFRDKKPDILTSRAPQCPKISEDVWINDPPLYITIYFHFLLTSAIFLSFYWGKMVKYRNLPSSHATWRSIVGSNRRVDIMCGNIKSFTSFKQKLWSFCRIPPFIWWGYIWKS